MCVVVTAQPQVCDVNFMFIHMMSNSANQKTETCSVPHVLYVYSQILWLA